MAIFLSMWRLSRRSGGCKEHLHLSQVTMLKNGHTRKYTKLGKVSVFLLKLLVFVKRVGGWGGWLMGLLHFFYACQKDEPKKRMQKGVESQICHEMDLFSSYRGLDTTHITVTRNFEPDPFLTSRRSRNGQKLPKTTFFNKKLCGQKSCSERH